MKKLESVDHDQEKLICSADGTRIASSEREFVKVVDVDRDVIVSVIAHPYAGMPWLSVEETFSPNGTFFAGIEDRGIVVWNCNDGKERLVINGKYDDVRLVTFGGNNDLWLCTDRNIRRFEITGKELHSFAVEDCRCVSASADGQFFAVATNEVVRVFEVTTGDPIYEFDIPLVASLTFSPDSTQLVVGDCMGYVSAYHSANGQPMWAVKPPGCERWSIYLPTFLFVIWVLVLLTSLLNLRRKRIERGIRKLATRGTDLKRNDLIRYENTIEDFVAFNKYHVTHAAAIKKALRTVALLTVLLTLAGITFQTLLDGAVERSILMAILGLTSICTMPLIVRWHNGSQVRSMYREGANKGLIGNWELELNDDHLIERNEFRETSFRLDAIERIVDDDGYSFVYYASVAAIVIPHDAVSSGNPEAFITELRSRKSNSLVAIREPRFSSPYLAACGLAGVR